jgi:hypothetical protein
MSQAEAFDQSIRNKLEEEEQDKEGKGVDKQ